MRSRPGRRALALASFFALVILACSDSGTEPDTAGPPASVELNGSGQTGPAGGALPSPVVVTVHDADGREVPNATVAWSTSDGSITGGATTNAQGQAQATWTLAPRLGAQAATVTVAGSLTADIGATATMPSTTSILVVDGHAQTDTVDAVLDTIVVELRLPSGAALPGVQLAWAVTSGGGSITPLAAQTDASGRVRAVWTLGPSVGTQRITVSALGLTAVAIDATAGPGAAALIDVAEDSVTLDKWGDTHTLGGTVTDRYGNALALALAWSSPDTLIARVDAGGIVTTHRAGRVVLTASAGAASAGVPVIVAQQRNPACVQPAPPQRPAPAGVPALGPAQVLTSLPDPSWPGWRSLPLDYDGDGDDDVIRLEYSFPGTVPYSGEVRVFRSDAGVMVDVTDSVGVAGIVPDHARDFELRDFDGDGAEDAYVAQHGYDAEPFPGTANLFLTFSGGAILNIAPTTFSPYEADGFSHGSSSADVDCDGDLDIVELNLLWHAPSYLFLNDGAGNFTAAGAAQFPPTTQADGLQPWQEVAFIDFDADADPDIFFGARSGSGWNVDALYVNDGFGNFRAWNGVDFPAPVFTPNRAVNNVKAADYDGDGLADLFLFEIPQPFSTESAVRLWLNQGDGVFADASASWGLPARCSAELVEPLFLTDMNRDGWPDLTIPAGCPELGQSGLLINTGTGFTVFSSSTIETWLDHDVVTPADVDGDGDPDLWFGEHGGNPVLVENQS